MLGRGALLSRLVDSSTMVSSVNNLANFFILRTRLLHTKPIRFSVRVKSGDMNKSCMIDLVNFAAQESCWFELIWSEIVRAAMTPAIARTTEKKIPIKVTTLLLFVTWGTGLFWLMFRKYYLSTEYKLWRVTFGEVVHSVHFVDCCSQMNYSFLFW